MSKIRIVSSNVFFEYPPKTVKFFNDIQAGDIVEFSLFNDIVCRMDEYRLTVFQKCIIFDTGDLKQLILYGFRDLPNPEEMRILLSKEPSGMKITRTFTY